MTHLIENLGYFHEKCFTARAYNCLLDDDSFEYFLREREKNVLLYIRGGHNAACLRLWRGWHKLPVRYNIHILYVHTKL